MKKNKRNKFPLKAAPFNGWFFEQRAKKEGPCVPCALEEEGVSLSQSSLAQQPKNPYFLYWSEGGEKTERRAPANEDHTMIPADSFTREEAGSLFPFLRDFFEERYHIKVEVSFLRYDTKTYFEIKGINSEVIRENALAALRLLSVLKGSTYLSKDPLSWYVVELQKNDCFDFQRFCFSPSRLERNFFLGRLKQLHNEGYEATWGELSLQNKDLPDLEIVKICDSGVEKLTVFRWKRSICMSLEDYLQYARRGLLSKALAPYSTIRKILQ